MNISVFPFIPMTIDDFILSRPYSGIYAKNLISLGITSERGFDLFNAFINWKYKSSTFRNRDMSILDRSYPSRTFKDRGFLFVCDGKFTINPIGELCIEFSSFQRFNTFEKNVLHKSENEIKRSILKKLAREFKKFWNANVQYENCVEPYIEFEKFSCDFKDSSVVRILEHEFDLIFDFLNNSDTTTLISRFGHKTYNDVIGKPIPFVKLHSFNLLIDEYTKNSKDIVETDIKLAIATNHSEIENLRTTLKQLRLQKAKIAKIMNNLKEK